MTVAATKPQASVAEMLAQRKKAAAAKAPAKDSSSSPAVTLPEPDNAERSNHSKLQRLVEIGTDTTGLIGDLTAEKDVLKKDLIPLAEQARQDQARQLKAHVSTLRVNGIAKYTAANDYGTPGLGLPDSLEAPLIEALGAERFAEYFTITTKTTLAEACLETGLTYAVQALTDPAAYRAMLDALPIPTPPKVRPHHDEDWDTLPECVRLYDALQDSDLLVVKRYVKPTEKFHHNLSEPLIAKLCAEYNIHPKRYFGEPPKSKR